MEDTKNEDFEEMDPDDVLTDISDVNEDEYNMAVEPTSKRAKQLNTRRKIEQMLEEQLLKRELGEFDEV